MGSANCCKKSEEITIEEIKYTSEDKLNVLDKDSYPQDTEIVYKACANPEEEQNNYTNQNLYEQTGLIQKVGDAYEVPVTITSPQLDQNLNQIENNNNHIQEKVEEDVHNLQNEEIKIEINNEHINEQPQNIPKVEEQIQKKEAEQVQNIDEKNIPKDNIKNEKVPTDSNIQVQTSTLQKNLANVTPIEGNEDINKFFKKNVEKKVDVSEKDKKNEELSPDMKNNVILNEKINNNLQNIDLNNLVNQTQNLVINQGNYNQNIPTQVVNTTNNTPIIYGQSQNIPIDLSKFNLANSSSTSQTNSSTFYQTSQGNIDLKQYGLEGTFSTTPQTEDYSKLFQNNNTIYGDTQYTTQGGLNLNQFDSNQNNTSSNFDLDKYLKNWTKNEAQTSNTTPIDLSKYGINDSGAQSVNYTTPITTTNNNNYISYGNTNNVFTTENVTTTTNTKSYVMPTTTTSSSYAYNYSYNMPTTQKVTQTNYYQYK